jgi:hypothetical protein
LRSWPRPCAMASPAECGPGRRRSSGIQPGGPCGRRGGGADAQLGPCRPAPSLKGEEVLRAGLAEPLAASPGRTGAAAGAAEAPVAPGRGGVGNAPGAQRRGQHPHHHRPGRAADALGGRGPPRRRPPGGVVPGLLAGDDRLRGRRRGRVSGRWRHLAAHLCPAAGEHRPGGRQPGRTLRRPGARLRQLRRGQVPRAQTGADGPQRRGPAGAGPPVGQRHLRGPQRRRRPDLEHTGGGRPAPL